MRRAWAEFIRAGEPTAPDERPNVCLQLIYRIAESHSLQCGRTMYDPVATLKTAPPAGRVVDG